MDPCIDPTREETYEFLDGFIGEMAALFPDLYFHIGGDEVNGNQWNQSARIQQFMRARGFRDNRQLQAYFNQRVQKIVEKYGKKMVGWDEILAPELPRDIVVQTWRDQKSLAESAIQGYQGILSYGYYIDLMQPASEHYAIDPLGGGASGLTPEQRRFVLGGEACMWSEYVTPENVDSRIWPRTAAIAERFWSPQDASDTASMYSRLEVVSRNLDWLGLTHNTGYLPMLDRLTGNRPAAALKVLADVVEPVKGYARENARKYTQFTPLIRLVDAARPESAAARELSAMVDAMLAGGLKSPEILSERLLVLERNHRELKPLLAASELLAEAVPISEDVSALAEAGLRALEFLDKRQKPPEAWLVKQKALIERAKKPRAELLIMIVPPVEKLVLAAWRTL
jgi:hexosaminidase